MNPLADQTRQATRDALEALDLLERAVDTHRTVAAAIIGARTLSMPGTPVRLDRAAIERRPAE